MGERLRAGREAVGLSTQAAAERARISTGYLFKLESGYVGTPSPRVLHRLSGVLGVPYWTLMRLAGYVVPNAEDPPELHETPTGEPTGAAAAGPAGEPAEVAAAAPAGDPAEVAAAAPAGEPASRATNAHIVDLLEEIRAELAALRTELGAGQRSGTVSSQTGG
jgi:transcriptional regulator with XRE-family HTH domain